MPLTPGTTPITPVLIVLQLQPHRPLLLWCAPSAQACLCWHSPQWAALVWHLWPHHHGCDNCGLHLLWLHHSDHPEDALSSWASQNLLYLRLPHDCSDCPYWDCLCHVCPAGSCAVHGAGQGGLCLLHHGHPNAQSSHLQPEKQGREGCPEETGVETHSFLKEDGQRGVMGLILGQGTNILNSVLLNFCVLKKVGKINFNRITFLKDLNYLISGFTIKTREITTV